MKLVVRTLAILIFLGVFSKTHAQRNWSLNGYVKYMQTNFVGKDTSGLSLLTDNLIHNRLNFSWYVNDRIETKIEMRNRAFYGEYTKLIPNYGDALEVDGGFFDLSWTLIDQPSFLLHSTIDRAFVQYQTDKYNLRLGRQRINWGLNTVYTPNDVFNAFNYFDFDYEERPGVDAARFEYYTSNLSSIDIALAPGRDKNDWVAAAKYGFNKGLYDFQIIGSWYKTDLMAGIGWAGNIGNAGFKGEASYFHPRDTILSQAVFTGTFTFDYTFSGGLYTSAALLYVSDGTTDPILNGGTLNLISGNISVKRLMPTKYTAMFMASKSLNPATNLSLLTMYAPGTNMLIVFPTLTYSIKENWDIDAVAQAAFMQINDEFKHGGSAAFLRLKRSF
ncbi:MAG: hypothetical protein ACPGLV_05450 [Bacteroidia bacterium]